MADAATIQRDLQSTISNTLIDLDNRLGKEMDKFNDQVTRELNNIMNNLTQTVQKSLEEISKQTITLNQEQMQTMKSHIELPGVVKESSKEKHLTPRDSEHNEDLPDFWRENFDYGESPYMHLDSIEKITDKPPFKKRKKSSLFRDLILLADKLDELGLTKEAEKIDDVLKHLGE